MSKRARTFHTSLLVNLSAGVLLLGVLLLLLSLYANHRAVEMLSGSLTKRMIATTDVQLRGFFETVQIALEISAERTYSGEFERFPLEEMDRYFVPLVKGMPQVSSLMYSHPNGDEYLLLEASGVWKSRHTRPERWGREAVWREWKPGGELSHERRPVDYDARRRPWHQGALDRLRTLGEDSSLRERIHWTEPYKFFTSKEPGVTASVAFPLASGEIAILAFDILLSDISDFTSQLEIGRNGKVFVLSGDPANPAGLVVVGLPAEDRFDAAEARIEFMLSPPLELGGPVSSFAEQAIAMNVQVEDSVRFTFEGRPWWGAITRSNLRTNKDIWVGSVVPEEQLLEGLPNTNLLVLLATCVIVALAVLRAFVLAKRYSDPLTGLSRRGDRMQRLNFEPVEPVESDITEIRQLSAALERMREALRSFSSEREDVRIARSIRSMTLPQTIPDVPGFEIHAWHQPADEVGGEAYDVVPIAAPGGVGDEPPTGAVVLAIDANGTGVGATVLGTRLLTVFRSGARTTPDLRELAGRINGFLFEDLPDAGPVRAWLLRLDGRSSTLHALGLGQEALLVRRADGKVERVPAEGKALGSSGTLDPPHPIEITLAAGETVVLASDGVLDAMDAERRRYRLDGLALALQSASGDSEIIARVRGDLESRSCGPCADRTLVVIRAVGQAIG